MLDAIVRLVRLLDNPADIPVLAPLFTKEILYRAKAIAQMAATVGIHIAIPAAAK